jgi:hypothetical protein
MKSVVFGVGACILVLAEAANVVQPEPVTGGKNSISTPETSPLFRRHVDSDSDVISYILEPGRFSHNQQSFYFAAKSMTDDGRFLLFYAADDEFSVKAGKRVKIRKKIALIDFLTDSFIMPDCVPPQIPFLDVREDRLYYVAHNPARICRVDLLVDPTREIEVCRIPVDEIRAGGEYISYKPTRLTLTADRSCAFLDMRVDDRFLQGVLHLSTGKFEKWCEADHVIDHGAINPVYDNIALGAWEVEWTDRKGRRHPIPVPTSANPDVIYPRLQLLRPGVSPETIPPMINNYATHENWAEDGKGFYYCSGRSGVVYHDISTGRQQVIAPMDAAHATMTKDNLYVTFDSNDFWWYRGCPWNVCFWNRSTNRGVYIHTRMPELCPRFPVKGQSYLHPDPHPQFVMNGRYIICTLNEPGRMNLSVTPVAQLIKRTTPDPMREASFGSWASGESPKEWGDKLTAAFLSQVGNADYVKSSAAISNWFAAVCRHEYINGSKTKRSQLAKIAPIRLVPESFSHPFAQFAKNLKWSSSAAEIEEFRRLASAVARAECGGMWPGIPDSEYFAWAFIKGVRGGWLDPVQYGPIARRAWLSLVRDIGKRKGVSESYEASLGAGVLWAVNAFNLN